MLHCLLKPSWCGKVFWTKAKLERVVIKILEVEKSNTSFVELRRLLGWKFCGSEVDFRGLWRGIV